MDEAIFISLPIDPAPTFEADVTIELPGSRAKALMRFEFNHFMRDELTALDREYMGLPPADAPIIEGQAAAPAKLMSDGDLIDKIVKRWVVGPVDRERRPIAYNRDALERLLNAYPAATSAIYVKFQRELREAYSKN